MLEKIKNILAENLNIPYDKIKYYNYYKKKSFKLKDLHF